MPPSSESSRRGIESYFSAFENPRRVGINADWYNAAKPADIAALFVSNGVYLTPGGTMLSDHQEMTAALAGRIKAGWTKETIKVIEAHPEGNDVWAIVSYEI